MDQDKLAKAFDQWMDDYIADPERFSREWQDVLRHTQERLGGQTPTYGQVASETLLHYLAGQGEGQQSPPASSIAP